MPQHINAAVAKRNSNDSPVNSGVALSDEAIIDRVKAGDPASFELICTFESFEDHDSTIQFVVIWRL